MNYSRENPSPRYQELVKMYRTMHFEGDAKLNIPPEKMFPGQSLPPQAGRIKQMIDRFSSKTLLDYGSGKGQQYKPMPVNVPGVGEFKSIPDFWGTEVTCYDPAYTPNSNLPEGKFDAVVSTDVLEHCPEDDMAWIIEEMFSYSSSFVYANVACYPAKKTLPNGENAHTTIKPVQWWKDLFNASSERNGNRSYLVLVEEVDSASGGIKTSAFSSADVTLS